MTPCPPGTLRLRDAKTPELGSAALSRAMAIPARTVRRWLAVWYSLGVAGVRAPPAAGRYGAKYVASADLPARWRRGELPDPFATAAVRRGEPMAVAA